MNACPYLVILFCLVGFGIHVSGLTPSPTPNPECPAMHRIAKSLDKGIQSFTKETTNCRVNEACTGLMCNGTHKQKDFYMKIELKHCKTPPEIHLDLVYKKKINFHEEMTDGSKKISNTDFKLNLILTKNGNQITTGLEIQVCVKILGCHTLFTLLPITTFCVNMKTCKGYNSTGDVPCHINPTGISPVTTMTGMSSTLSSEPLKTASTVKVSTELSSTPSTTTLKSRSYSSTRYSEPLKTASTVKVSTERSSTTSTTLKPRSYSSTQHSGTTTAPPGDNSARKRGSGHHHMSVGVVVGIVLAGIVAVLVMVAATFYWKKCYRRSRLRAAYYNDISMNDPLYEDFGPEEA